MSKLLLRDKLIVNLYFPATKYMNKRLVKIIHKNANLHDSTVYSGKLIYKGHLYKDLNNLNYVYGKTFEAHPSVHEELDKYIKDNIALDKEIEESKLQLSYLIAETTNIYILREVLGDSLSELIDTGYLYPSSPIDTIDSSLKVLELKGKYKELLETLGNRQIDNMICKTLYANEE